MRTLPHARNGMLLAMVLAASSGAMAQQPSFVYGGIGVGGTRTGMDKDSLAITGATASSVSTSDKDLGSKIFAGYAFNRNLAVEFGYVDLGEIKATRTMTAPTTGGISIVARNTGVFLDLVATAPVGASNLSLLGKIGAIGSTTDKRLTYTGTVTPAAGVPTSTQERETNWKFGAGAQFDINQTMMARAEWERHTDLGKDLGIGRGAADLFSVNLLLRFK